MLAQMSYIAWLRSQIGRRKTILVYSTVIAQDPVGRILLQRRSDFDWWGLPGGILEAGEDILTCARREFFEETGLHITGLQLLGIYSHPRFDVVYPNGDAIQQFTVCFAGQAGNSLLQPDGEETLALEFVAPNRLDALSIPAWYRAMIADRLDQQMAAFEWELGSGAAASPEPMPDSLWRLPGSIMPAAVAVVRRADGHVLLPQDADGERRLPWRPMALGETVADTAVRAAAIPECRPVRLLGVISRPGCIAASGRHTDHIVAGVFLLEMSTSGRGLVDSKEWVDPRALAQTVTSRQTSLATQVAGVLAGGVFVDDRQEPSHV